MIALRCPPLTAYAAAACIVMAAALPGCAARTGPDGAPLSEDERITRDLLRSLADDDDIVIEDLSVETRDGIVVISGVQPTLDQVREILRRASRVRGVNEVVNRVRVIGSPLVITAPPRF